MLKYATKFFGLLVLVMGFTSAFAISQIPEYVVDEQLHQDERAAIRRMSERWEHSLNNHKPEQTVSLYDNSFYLYATLKTKISTYDELMVYFKKLAEKDSFKVVFSDQNIRVYGAVAVNSGLYTFSYLENGKKVEIPARFTFVYLLNPEGWRIVDHHSSALPE